MAMSNEGKKQMSYIKREIEEEFKSMSSCYPVVSLIGPRQSGKTTLVKKIFPQKPYVNLENIDERNFAKEDPRGFLNRFSQGCVLDEIQREPSILSYIQTIVDSEDVKGKYILTGSHQLSLSENINQSLAGRTAILKLLPLTISELETAKPNMTLDEHLFYGSYPRIFKDGLNPTKLYRDYVGTYLERDVRQIINLKDLTLFQKFLKICAGRIGQIFSSSAISNEIGVSHHTIQNWLSVLEASFIVFRLAPYYENFGKRVVKSPKLYFTDVGLASYLLDINDVSQIQRDPLRGSLVENMVILDIYKTFINKGIEPPLYYFRDHNGHEVDLIVKSGNSLIPIEIKSSKTFQPSFLENLEYFKKLTTKAKDGFLIYSGDQEQQVKSFRVVKYQNASRYV